MQLFLIAALVCFCIALAVTLGAGTVLGAGALTWLCGGFIATTCHLLFGDVHLQL